jgi:NTP pyrophosphatase (non-canonical NTP hydrolase)
VEEEIADVLLYLVRLADLLGVDLMRAAERKIALNEKKYPAEEVRGSADKR